MHWFANEYHPAECPYLGDCLGLFTFSVTNSYYTKQIATAVALTAKGTFVGHSTMIPRVFSVVICRDVFVKAGFTRRVVQVQVQPMHEPKKKAATATEPTEGEENSQGTDDAENEPKKARKKGNPILVDKAIFTPTRARIDEVMPFGFQPDWSKIADTGYYELLAPLNSKCRYSFDLKNTLSKAKKARVDSERFQLKLWIVKLPSSEFLEK